MVSFGSGGVPGASTKLTNLETRYVPLPVTVVPSEAKVVHVPPPVTFCGLPGFERKVPAPVRVIFVLSFARADAFPPAETVPVAKLMLTMSQRINALPGEPLAGEPFPGEPFPGGGPFAGRAAVAIAAMTRPAANASSNINLERFISSLLLRLESMGLVTSSPTPTSL
jgi:hypothetical protein